MMSHPRHILRIARPQYKFSSAHMTLFPDGTKEALHGHNFTLSVEVSLRSVEGACFVNFRTLRQALALICASLNGRMLVAQDASATRLETLAIEGIEHIRLVHKMGTYVFPASDVALLPIDNISSERLAEYCHARFVEHLRGQLSDAQVQAIESAAVTVEEVAGQGATYTERLSPPPALTQDE